MDNNKQQLREGINTFTIIGTLKEKNLEVKNDFVDKKTGGKYTAIVGDLVVKVGDNDEHTIKFFSREKTKDGNENKLFKAYKTVMDNYISMADIATMPNEDREGIYPTRLSIQGELSINDYYSNNELHSYPELRGKFVSSIKTDDIEDCAEFDAEIYIDSMKNELDKDGIETNRAEIKGIIPIYGGRVIPINFKVTDDYEVADYMMTNFDVGDTVSIWGKIINSAIIKENTKSGFGKDKKETTTSYRNEILINGGEEDPLNDTKAFDSELIKKALVERENYLNELKEKGEKNTKTPKKQMGFGGGKARSPRDISKDDIPF